MSDINAILASLEQVWGRLRMVVGRGAVTASTDAGSVQTMQIRLGPELRDDLPRLTEYGLASRPHPGADVICLFAAGDRSNGLVIATGDQRYRLRALSDGEVALYDDLGQAVHLTRKGIVIKGAGLPITVTSSPKVRLETDRLEVTGDIIDRCGDQTHTLADMRSIYDSHTHDVRAVKGGSDMRTSEPPSQVE